MTTDVKNGAARAARWAAVVQQMTIDCGANDVLVYGEGAEALGGAMGRQVRGADPLGPTSPGDIVLCDGPLDGIPPASIGSALDELAALTRRSALVVFPVKGASGAVSAMPLDWWQSQLDERFDVLHLRDLGGGEGLALVVARPEQATAQAVDELMQAASPRDTGVRRVVPPVSTQPPAPGIVTQSYASDPADTPGSTIRVFIGTEPRMRIAETVLRFSIETNTQSPTEIISMDYSRGGVWGGWDIGRPQGRPATRSQNTIGNAVWFTDFTNFRWAIPEVCGFSGRAIYVDVDILLLSDIKELINLPMTSPVLSLTASETSVMLFDCSAFRRMPGWPSLAQMKTNGWGIRQYIEHLEGQGAFGQLPPDWNCLDGDGFVDGRTNLVHYTSMDTQPWRPYPDRIPYRAHPVPAMEHLWFLYAKAARETGRFEDPAATLQLAAAAGQQNVMSAPGLTARPAMR